MRAAALPSSRPRAPSDALGASFGPSGETLLQQQSAMRWKQGPSTAPPYGWLRSGRRRIWPALLSLLVASPALADCPLDLGHGTGIVFYSDRYMIAFRPDPMRIEVGLPFG